MRKRSRILIVIFMLFLMLQPFKLKHIKAAEAQKNIIILLDNSGSMQDTDPDKLSIAAASMLVDTLDENTNLNIISFGDKADYSQRLSDKPSREALKTRLSSLTFDDDRTNLKEGMKEALDQLKDIQGEKIIIILSDGKEDPIRNINEEQMSEHMKELFLLGDQAYDMRIKVHCIGLSKGADEDTLIKISSKTGGDYFYSETASELFNVFNNILGNLNGFSTIEQFTTNSTTDREIKISSYIEEVIIKIASCNNSSPLVDVTFEEGITPDFKAGDKYKIYKFSSSNNNTIRVTASEEEGNVVIVQVKSKVPMSINSSSDNLSIPFKVPMDIHVNLQSKENIKSLHMDKLEEGIRERINIENNEFKFTFKKDKPGRYPIFLTAYDGNGNIVTVKEINIIVKDYPPFYYTASLPTSILTENSFRVEIKQQDDSKVDNPEGEVCVNYGDDEEEIPLKFENGVLAADVVIKKAGDIKIRSRIGVIRDNKNYSYYLPYFNLKALEKPFVELKCESYEKPFKLNEAVELKLSVMKNSIYQNERFFVYNNQDKVGEFVLKPEGKGNIAVPLKALPGGENFTFTVKAENDKSVKVTDTVRTNIRIISNSSYFIEENIGVIVFIFIVIIIVVLIIAIGLVSFKVFIESYKVSKEINYYIRTGGGSGSTAINLNSNCKTVFLNLIKTNIEAGEEPNNAIGSISLNLPEEKKVWEGLKFIAKKFILRQKDVFEVKYSPIGDQRYDDNTPVGEMDYTVDTHIYIKKDKKDIQVSFL